MASLIFQHHPNWTSASAAPGDTSWHQLSIPAGIIQLPGLPDVTIGITTLDTLGTSPGSPVLIELNVATSPSNPGFPAVGTLVVQKNTTVWYKLTVSTDTVYFVFTY